MQGGVLMPRPHKCRRICGVPAAKGMAPLGRAAGESILLRLEEYEALRLIDLEGWTQQQCAEQMGVGRTTVTAIYDQARRKMAEALVLQKNLLLSGGKYAVCGAGTRECRRCCHCQRRGAGPEE